jgi:hypothetical protein
MGEYPPPADTTPFLLFGSRPPRRRPAGFYFFFLGAWARSDAIGPRSRFGVAGLRRSLPACDAVFFEVAMERE